MKVSKSMAQALEFKMACEKYGYAFSASGHAVRISKSFTPNDPDAFIECDGSYYSVLSLAPLKGGSIWGTDGGSVGGFVALKSGQFVMNKSGEGSRFLAALKKLG